MAGGVKERREWVDGCVQTNFTIEGNLISEMLFVRLIREEREREEGGEIFLVRCGLLHGAGFSRCFSG